MSWSDLPQDILWLVVRRLYIMDRVKLRAVCQNWRRVPCYDKLPWLFNYCVSPSGMICTISDPYHKLPYILEEKGRFNRPLCCASRFGWLLFFQRTLKFVGSNIFSQRVLEYYVCNPHTKVVIPLPALYECSQQDDYSKYWATFSFVPTSPDCMFVVATTSHRGRNFFVSTYSIGDEAWKTVNIPAPHPRYISTPLMAYMDGSFYYYNYDGDLSVFNIATKEWRVLFSETFPLWNEWMSGDTLATCYFVAYDAHLHLVFLYGSQEEDFLDWQWLEEDEEEEVVDWQAVGCDIFRYDWMNGHWKRMKSLEGGALFLGDRRFGVPSLGVLAAAGDDETIIAANTVYYRCSPLYKPRFFVYGRSEDGRKKNELRSESSRSKLYNETLSWTMESDQSFHGARKYWIWMEPPSLTS